jgi:hypothetical protein
MPGTEAEERYKKYHCPVQPADPNAEYLTVQETAWVFGCSVKTIRRALNNLDAPHSRVGRRIVTNRADRAALYDLRRIAPKPGRPRRKTGSRKPLATAA